MVVNRVDIIYAITYDRDRRASIVEPTREGKQLLSMDNRITWTALVSEVISKGCCSSGRSRCSI